MSTFITLATANGEQHGMINQLANSVPYDDFKHAEPSHKEKMKKDLARRKKIVKGRYINYRSRTDRCEKAFCAGPGEPIQMWKLIPDHVYDLPQGLIDEVNASFIPVRADLLSVDGKDVNNGKVLDKDGQERIHEIVPASF